MASPSPRGRPRDPGLDKAILGAARALLSEVGYDGLTVRAIAQRAGTGLATLYRRWPTKEELVVDAVKAGPDAPVVFPDGADPFEAMTELMGYLLDTVQGEHGWLVRSLIAQGPEGTALAEALRAKVVRPRLEALTRQLSRIDGVDPRRAEAAALLIPAMLIFKVLVLGERADEADTSTAVALAVRAARA